MSTDDSLFDLLDLTSFVPIFSLAYKEHWNPSTLIMNKSLACYINEFLFSIKERYKFIMIFGFFMSGLNTSENLRAPNHHFEREVFIMVQTETALSYILVQSVSE